MSIHFVLACTSRVFEMNTGMNFEVKQVGLLNDFSHHFTASRAAEQNPPTPENAVVHVTRFRL